ncbi:MAG: bifunctional diaminohydroxyphosphoribosylaminopyrimidine deaminase/5-amino-6-(5-phosphoribosylamino)uracil reductase RibD [Lachnospiraceae bacterium]|nr:bifunctional diaminohydroxyphosphoribosylaminopyrimidine deaminase/5-amino-6-(5-phosphoribosylamino)uracil reductase RibD [Lachnospiraceae bacterium]
MNNTTDNTFDKKYMQRAIELALRGTGAVNPNPLVGAVIVKDGRVIGEGYHTKYGELHAEREAIKSLKESAEGAVMYVTLEPCCHTGKQPPCTEAVVEAGIKKVYVGSNDPNPLVAGKGIDYLRAHGVEVETEIMKEECDAINRVFFHYITTGRPYIVFKYAMSMDGKIATSTGESRWISCEESRKRVQEMRRELTGIMVGSGTVLADDPMLNYRGEAPDGGAVRQPVRIVCDGHLRLPVDAKFVKTAAEIRTVVAYNSGLCGDDKTDMLESAGVELLDIPLDKDSEKIDLSILLDKLGEMKIDGILLEGGGALADSFVRAGLVDEVRAFVAPKLIGGTEAKTPVGGRGVERLEEAYGMKLSAVETIGEDVMLTYIRRQ